MSPEERGAPDTAKRPPFIAARAATGDRAPLLVALAEALPAPLALALQTVVGAEVSVDEPEHAFARLADLVERHQNKALAAVFTVAGWEAPLIVLVERPMIDALLEVALGAGSGDRYESEARPITALESSFVQLLCETMVPALRDAVVVIPGARPTFSHVEKRLALLDEDRKAGAAATLRFGVSALGRSGAFNLVVPAAVLPRFRAAAGPARNETAKRDPQWMSHLKDEVGQATIELRAVIRDKSLTLGDIARMRPGQVLRLDAQADAPVLLEAQNRPVFWCELGRDGRNFTVRLDTRVDDAGDAEPLLESFDSRDPLS